LLYSGLGLFGTKKEEEKRRIGVFSIIIIIATCSKVHNAEQ